MAKSSKRAYWINLAKNNPEEYKRRSRIAYWKNLQESNPEEFKARQRENKLREKHPGMSREEAAKIIATTGQAIQRKPTITILTIKNNINMKTVKRIKIFWAIVCTLIAIGLCIAVKNEWTAQGCTKIFSIVAECIVYCAGCVGLFICGKELVDFIDYWWFNGDEYYKGRK